MKEVKAESVKDIQLEKATDREDDLLKELEGLINIPTEVFVESELLEEIPTDLQHKLGPLLREFRRQPLLSREDEFRLFILIQAGRQMRELLSEHSNSSDLDVIRHFVMDVFSKAITAHAQLALLCKSEDIKPPNVGEIFSEIFLQRILKLEYHSNTLVEWFENLTIGGSLREKAGMLALSLPILVMLLPEQVLGWLSGHLAVDENSLPSIEETQNWLANEKNLSLDAGCLLDVADSAWEKMLLSNLRLVASIARRYIGQGEDIADLIQVGTIGLMRAVDKFNPALGYKFSTYSSYWIRQAITRHIADQSRLIRLPVHIHGKVQPLLRIRDRLFQELGREPTCNEMARACNPPVSEADIERILLVMREPLSLDMKASEDKESVLGDLIIDNTELGPEEQIITQYLQDAISRLLGILDDRHRKILEMRFGFSDGQVRTLEEIAKEIGVTRERVRQIENGALRKLRHPTRSGHLIEFLH